MRRKLPSEDQRGRLFALEFDDGELLTGIDGMPRLWKRWRDADRAIAWALGALGTEVVEVEIRKCQK